MTSQHPFPRNALAPPSDLSFGAALDHLKAGKRIARTQWALMGCWLERTESVVYVNYPKTSNAYPGGARMSWTPASGDLLADDWYVRTP